MHTDVIAGITIIGRKHTNKNGKHRCITPTLYVNGKLFHELSANKALFVDTKNWFWKPSAGFYGIYSIRTTDLALVDFYDHTTFDDALTTYVDYLAGA